MPRATHWSRSSFKRRGFTLVELLVALVIAVLVASVLVALYGVATRTVFDQQQRARGPHAASRALDLLGEDLGRALLSAAATNDLLVLEQGGTNQPEGSTASLSFLTLDPTTGEEPDWTIARRVFYRVETEGPLASGLVRIHQPLSGPGSLDPPTTNLLVRGVNTFSIELFDGAAWQDAWSGEAKDGRRPQLARVILGSRTWSGSPTQRAELLIPAGHSVTSTLIRSSATTR